MNFKINGATADTIVTSSAGIYFVDDNTPYSGLVGAVETSSGVFAEGFSGFMYSFYLDNSYLSGGASTHFAT